MLKMFSLGTLAIALLISMSGVSEADSVCDIPNNRALTTTDPTRFLLPAPKEVQEFKETCRLSIHTRVIKKKIETWDGFFDPPRDLGPHGYVLEVGPSGVEATATTNQGLFYASQTFAQLAHFGEIPAMRIIDWPDVPNRMALSDVRDMPVHVPYMKRWLTELSGFKTSHFMPFMEDDFKYRSRPYLGRSDAFTHEKARQLVEHSRKRHIVIVPQVESRGHGQGLLKHDELKEVRLAGDVGQFCPCTEETYELFRDIYKELVEAFPDSNLFHVGMDEVGGWEKGHPFHYMDDPRCRDAVSKLGPSGLFGLHADRLKVLVDKLYRHMMIWHDELTKTPGLYEKIDKDIIVVIWLYARTDDFHEVRQFKDWGFKAIWGAPAVDGYDDVYQQLPITFGNLAGWAREAVKENLPGIITTTWGPIRGGSAENYLYGLAYSAQVMWNSKATDIADFNRRFAYTWFGITKSGASEHIDRLFWFPWRVSGSAAWDHKDIEGYWQTLSKSRDTLFRPFDEFIKEVHEEVQLELKQAKVPSTDVETQKRVDEKLQKRIDESKRLLTHIALARESLAWSQHEIKRNAETLESMGLILNVYEHIARKAIAVWGVALAYRTAYRENLYARAKLISILERGAKKIGALKSDFVALKAGYARAVTSHGGNPTDVPRLLIAEASLGKLVAMLKSAASDIRHGGVAPDPEDIGFALE